MHGLDTYDYGARQYDPLLCRWTSIDPLCEKYYGVSPYAYCMNNPVMCVDPDGRKVQIPEKQTQQKLVSYINSISYYEYGINDKGYLYNTGKKSEKGKSKLYSTRIDNAIAKKELSITIYIDDKYTDLKNGNGQYYSVSAKGEGITQKEDNKTISVTISDKVHTVEGEEGKDIVQSPAEILMHELVGHAIPAIAPSKEVDTGNAIENENKVRKEIEAPLRKVKDDKQ